jgi:ketosteroid isomerase-like protein
MTIDELLDIESIKHLRALGSKHLDSGDLEALVDLYTEDAVCEFGPYGSWHDRDTFLANFAEAEAPFYKSGYFSNLHVIANHVVELTGPDTASGLVYLLDFVAGDMMREGGNPLYWLGVYDERYRRGDGGWRISKQSLNFVWPQRMLNDGFLEQHAPSSHLTRLTTEPFRA